MFPKMFKLSKLASPIGPHKDRNTITHTYRDRGGITLAWQHSQMCHTSIALAPTHEHTKGISAAGIQKCITPGTTMCVHLC